MSEANQDQRSPVDFRPAGAVAGAALPAKSLWDYVRHDYPAYKKLLEAAEDATDANGNVDVKKVMERVRAGDYGLSGVQGSEDPFTNTLVHGSNSASGGPGAHGQIAGPNVKADSRISRTAKGEMPPDLAYLMNDKGELYSPRLVRNREKFIRGVNLDHDHRLSRIRRHAEWSDSGAGATETYGNLKERLRGDARGISAIKKRQAAWTKYDKARSEGWDIPEPKGARPSAGELAKAKEIRTDTVGKFKKFLTDDDGKTRTFFDQKRPLTEAKDFFEHEINIPKPTAHVEAQRQRLVDLASRFGDSKSPNAQNMRTSILKQTKALDSNAPLARSRLFKPKQFETFVPTVLHGGMNTGISGTAPKENALESFITSFIPDRFREKAMRGLGYGPSAAMEWMRDNAEYVAQDKVHAQKNPGHMYNRRADNLYKHTINEGSSINPNGYYFGRKGTLWLRPKNNAPTGQTLERLIKAEGLKPYAAGNAAVAAIGEITGLSNLAKYIPGFNKAVNTCHGHMCGSFPAQVYGAAGSIKNKLPEAITLPNRVALSGEFEPVIATNKQLLLKQLRTAGGRRALLGAGAMGLMGGAGYAGAGALQNSVRSALPPPPPVPAPKPSFLPTNLRGMGKYAPIAAVGAGGLAALAAAHAWGRSRRKKPEEAPSPAPA